MATLPFSTIKVATEMPEESEGWESTMLSSVFLLGILHNVQVLLKSFW